MHFAIVTYFLLVNFYKNIRRILHLIFLLFIILARERISYLKNDIITIARNNCGETDVQTADNLCIVPFLQRKSITGETWDIREKRRVFNTYLPNYPQCMLEAGIVTAATCSKDGQIFVAAIKAREMLYVYTTKTYKYKTIKAPILGCWVISIAISPNNEHIAFSSNNGVFQCTISNGIIEKLPINAVVGDSLVVKSLIFSQNGKEIFCGADDCSVYIFNRELRIITRSPSHLHTVNTVALVDDSSYLFLTGSEDRLCKVWDRRVLHEYFPVEIGIFAGHMKEVLHVDSRGDRRYLITNSGDHSIKLWDLRFLSFRSTRIKPKEHAFDGELSRHTPFEEYDTSVMTYHGHVNDANRNVYNNPIIHCHFSPAHTTGQKYIYIGDAHGRIIVYDILSGKVVHSLSKHFSIVQDVICHPFDNHFISISIDGFLTKWTYKEYDTEMKN